MGHSRDEKAESHRRIVEVAAAKLREDGIAGVGIADLMAACEMTHGGFYRHFESRDQLVAEAVEHALARGAERVAGAITGSAPFDSLVTRYLSPAHRDGRAEGCAVAGLGTDVSRSNARARAAYTRQVRDYLTQLDALLGSAKPARQASVAALSAMVGALVMARAVDDDALSLEILRLTAAALKATRRPPAAKSKPRAAAKPKPRAAAKPKPRAAAKKKPPRSRDDG
jgi:TetR/AcrR family transcriptional regulator, transcriptional repressor for nem operon